MKKLRSNSHCASTLQIALSAGLTLIPAILLALAASTNTKRNLQHDPYGFQLNEGASVNETLGNYPDTSVPLSGNTVVAPDAAPTNTTSINVSTNTNFKGTFAASPTTGVVAVTDAHPSGNYTVIAVSYT